MTTKIPLRDETGNIFGTFGISHDVTERKKTELKLREQAALLDIATDAILVRDMQNQILYWNKGAERIFGWRAEKVKGKNVDELLFGASHAAELEKAFEVVTQRGEWSGDFHQKSRDGRELAIEARWTLVRDEQGMPTGILIVSTDVTERRAIQSQLLRVQRLESLGTLAGGIAHDLNNVLSPIHMGVEGLSLQHSDGNTRKMLKIMGTAAHRGASIVRQVLSFARGVEGEHAEVQLEHVIRGIEQIINGTFPNLDFHGTELS